MPFSGGGFGSRAVPRAPMRRAWAWPVPSMRCSVRWWPPPTALRGCWPAGFRRPPQGGRKPPAGAGGVLFPGGGFVELAIRAGDEVSCGCVDELTLHAPLILGAAGVQIQVIVGGTSDDTVNGVRTFSVFSRAGEDGAWVLHAEGVLSPTSAEVEPADLSTWPPAGATPVDASDVYAVLAGRGYEYGPAFQGLTAVWRRGDEIFAEVAVPEAAGSVTGVGVHPALLDSALHAVALTAPEGQTALPFSWQGVRLHAAGAAAARARIAPSGQNAMSIELADGLGLPVLSVASMVARPVSTEALHAAMAGGAGRGDLFELTWSPAGTPAETSAIAVTDWNDLTDATELPDGAVVL